MKLRWKLLLTVITILVAPFLLVIVMHFKFKHDLETYKKSLIARGEKLAVTDWIPHKTTNDSSGRLFLESVRPFADSRRDHHPSAMRMVASGRAQAGWKHDELYDGDSKKRTNIWLLIENEFESNRGETEQLREATDNGKLIFPLAYQQGFRLSLLHLSKIKQGATWLSTATLYELHRGNKVEAAENLKALLRLVGNYRDEPLLISQLVRIACLQIAFSTTWDVLQYPDWSEAELKDFQESWAAIDLSGLENVFGMERAMGIQTYVEARRAGQSPLQMISGGNASLSEDWDEFSTKIFTEPAAAFKMLMNRPNQKVWSYLLSYREELAWLKMWQTEIDATRSMEKERRIDAPLTRLRTNLKEMGPLESELYGAEVMTRTITKLASAKIARQLAGTASALFRFKLEHGKFPSALAELAPKILPALPTDPIDGKPLRYRLNSEGNFLLYSIGENGIDDNGDPRPENPTASPDQKWNRPRHPLFGRDWVWPLPATEEQILEWEKHESKKVE
ncbi:MAG: hypothetical protein ABI042_14100 [Verrucomicrobiota bacterium]